MTDWSDAAELGATAASGGLDTSLALVGLMMVGIGVFAMVIGYKVFPEVHSQTTGPVLAWGGLIGGVICWVIVIYRWLV